MDVCCRMNETLTLYLFIAHIIRLLKKLWANLTIVLEVYVLACKLIFVSRDISKEVTFRVV